MSPRSWHSRLFTKTSQLCQFAGCHLFGGQMVGQAQARWAAKERSAPRDAPSSYACDPSQTLLESDGGPLRLLGSQHRGNPVSEIRCQFTILARVSKIRCQFIILARGESG